MIYPNSDEARTRLWTLDENPEAGSIARHFLAGELDLLRFSRSNSALTDALASFLDSADGAELEVHRGDDDDLLVTATEQCQSLLLTGRTANVLRSYIDSEIVKMEDRFDMTVRHAALAVC